jgi:hypothetical protein
MSVLINDTSSILVGDGGVLASIIDSPMQLSSNFVLSCEANDLMGYNIGDAISSWTDNSGLNNHLVQSLVSKQPIFNIDSFGFKCLDFNQTNFTNLYSTLQFAQANNITVVQAVRVDEFISGLFKVLNIGDSSVSIDRVQLFASSRRISFIAGNASEGEILSSVNTNFNSSKCVVAFRRTPTRVEMWLNFRKILDSVLTNLTFAPTLRTYNLGRFAGTGDAHINGANYQFHVCHEAFTDQKLKQLIRYTAFKSGIAI